MRVGITYIRTFVIVCFSIFIFGCAGESTSSSSATVENASASDTAVVHSSASWESPARTVAEAARESDIIVRARVIQEPVTRVLDFGAPITNEDGTPTDAVHTTTIAFADTLVEVITTYKGSPPNELLVMQTGGTLPSGQVAQLSDDPLYRVGDEYILFLVDISGDNVHAPDRELYRIVSPVGRFLINGDTATTFAEEYMRQQLPTTTTQLERQVTEAVAATSN